MERVSVGETKEYERKQVYDSIIVFGEGPNKRVLLPHEATPLQKATWESFTADPLHTPEPHFYIVEGTAFQEADENKRQQMQHIGRFALRRMGRQNALAAGVALVNGLTHELILSGGRTVSPDSFFADEYRNLHPDSADLSEEKRNNAIATYKKEVTADWPSEAELMADVVKRRFGAKYEEKYGKPIDEVMKLESDATNTLENIVLTINKQPELLKEKAHIGFLTADYHVDRAASIGNRFGIYEAEGGKLSAQHMLRNRAEARSKAFYVNIEDVMLDNETDYIRDFMKDQRRWIFGLTDPEYAGYWIGYLGKLEDPSLIQSFFNTVTADDRWTVSLRRVLHEAGIDFDTLVRTDLPHMAKNDPQAYNDLRAKFSALTTSAYREPIMDRIRSLTGL
jgi:hypothetical protein